MGVLLWAIAMGLVGTALVVATYMAFTGVIGVVTGERFVRCPRCGRHGLAQGEEQLHPRTCPATAHVVQLVGHSWGWVHDRVG